MTYPQTVYNQNGGKLTFVEVFQKGIAKYFDIDGETILFLTCFNNNKCVELFDGKITKNQFTY